MPQLETDRARTNSGLMELGLHTRDVKPQTASKAATEGDRKDRLDLLTIRPEPATRVLVLSAGVGQTDGWSSNGMTGIYPPARPMHD